MITINISLPKQPREVAHFLKEEFKRLAKQGTLQKPKSGNGANVTIGDIKLQVLPNSLKVFVIGDTKTSYRRHLEVYLDKLRAISFEPTAKLVIINEKVAFSYET